MATDPMLQAYLGFYASGKLMRPSDALHKLREHPKTFLRTYPVIIDERQGASGLVTAHLTNNPADKGPQRPGSVLGTHHMHDTQGFYINCGGPPPGSFPQTRAAFQAHYVEMRPSTDAAISWYSLTGGPDIMLTCKLTGCSFLVRQQGTNMECAHVKPSGGITGANLQRNLQQPGQTVYGGLDYDTSTRSVSIIGVRRAGQWKIFMQKHEAGTWKIRSVHRIYPPE